MRLTLTSAPSADLVDLASAKVQCRVDTTDDDDFIEGLIGAASQHLDTPHGILGRAVMPQVWLLELKAWPTWIALPVEPVRSVTVTYTDSSGAEQTLAPETYTLSAWPSRATEWSFVDGAARPDLGAVEYPVKITINAGYADAASVPKPLQAAIKMLVAHWYDHREAVAAGAMSEVPMAVNALIAPYRRLV